MSKFLKKFFITIIILLIAAYVLGIIYFSENTYPNTRVNGVDKSLISKNNAFRFNTDDYKLLITGKEDDKLELNTDDISLSKTVVGKPELKQNVYVWPFEVFGNHEYKIDMNVNYSKSALEEKLKKSPFFNNVTEPKDAELVINDNKAEIVPEVVGNKLDLQKLLSKIDDAIVNDKDKIELKEEYILPKVKKDDKNLIEERDKLNKLVTANYLFDFVDRKWELTGKELLEMFDLKENDYIMNRQKLRDYIKKIAIETDTYAQPHKFNATGLGEITVPGGIYGWQMNVDKTTDNVMKMIEEGKTGKVEPVYNQEARHRETNDIGNTYIEIDLSRQHMWFYKDGKLIVDTPIVTGDARKKSSTTPTGVNMVWSKEEDRKLNGIGLTGKKYSVPVKYWMPIGWTGSGIHDVSYRKKFGGQIYKTNGSSSCINTPLAAVEKIFKNVPMHTAVVTYESSTNYSPSEFERQEDIRKGKAKKDVQ